MQTKKTTRIISAIVSAVVAFSVFPTPVARAANNSIYITPSTQSVQPGQSFTVQVRGNISGNTYDPDSVAGTITFPSNLLQVMSTSTTGATFDWQPTVSVGNGVINFNENSLWPLDETAVLIMSITFKALANGTATVGMNSNVAYYLFGGQQPLATTRSGGVYTISTPPPPTCPAGQIGTPPNCTTPPPTTCPAGQVGTPPNCTTPPPGGGGTSQPSTPKPTTPTTPTITDTPIPTLTTQPDATPVQVDAGDLSIKDVVAKVTRQSNSVTWKTSLPDATTDIAIGTSKEKLTIKPVVNKQPDGSYIATMDNLKRGARYYFTITATTPKDPNKQATFSGAFTTRGYPVELIVTKAGKKIPNATITIERQSFKTDKNGALSLELTNDTFNADITLPDNKTKKSVTFTVAEKKIPEGGGNPETQQFTFEVSGEQSTDTGGASLLWPIIGAIGTLLPLGIGLFLFLLYRRRKADENTPAMTSSIDGYTWTQAGTEGDGQMASMYLSSPPQQPATDLASLEQQYIPEAESAIENGYPDLLTVQPETPPLPTDSPSLVAQQPDSDTTIVETYEEPTAPLDPAPLLQQEPLSVNDPVEVASLPTESSLENTEAMVIPTPEVPIQAVETAEDIPNVSPTQYDPVPGQASTDNGEEAIYHPDTGELDIIHGHPTPSRATLRPQGGGL